MLLPSTHSGSILDDAQSLLNPISPMLELGAYEALWEAPGATFKRIADRFRERPGALPSDLVPKEVAELTARQALEVFRKRGTEKFNVAVYQSFDYPRSLRDARNPIELVYYLGDTNLIGSRGVSIVGSRNPSEDGRRRARRLARALVDEGYVVVSGLARGIDSEAHLAAMEHGGRTVGVIGKPLYSFYPPENTELQRRIAREHLLISQVPALAFERMSFQAQRGLFAERNATMSAFSLATIIVEAGESSGTLTQARAALAQGRKLLILDSCFQNSALSWPKKFLKRGALRVSSIEQVKEILEDVSATAH